MDKSCQCETLRERVRELELANAQLESTIVLKNARIEHLEKLWEIAHTQYGVWVEGDSVTGDIANHWRDAQ